MDYKLSSDVISKGYSLLTYEVVASTNDTAFELADKFCSKLWVVSAEQNSGRGRRGRTWVSPKGNLYSSLLLSENLKVEDCIALSYIAGVSLMDSIYSFDRVDNSVDITIKWPNDILINGAKASGILLETKKINNRNVVVVGIGLNILTKPEIDAYPTTCLHDSGIICTPEQLFERLSYYWIKNYDIYHNNDGKKLIIKKWLDYCSLVGKPVTVKLKNKSIIGSFEGLSEEFGCLIKMENNDTITINSGDILLGGTL